MIHRTTAIALGILSMPYVGVLGGEVYSRFGEERSAYVAACHNLERVDPTIDEVAQMCVIPENEVCSLDPQPVYYTAESLAACEATKPAYNQARDYAHTAGGALGFVGLVGTIAGIKINKKRVAKKKARSAMQKRS